MIGWDKVMFWDVQPFDIALQRHYQHLALGEVVEVRMRAHMHASTRRDAAAGLE